MLTTIDMCLYNNLQAHCQGSLFLHAKSFMNLTLTSGIYFFCR